MGSLLRKGRSLSLFDNEPSSERSGAPFCLSICSIHPLTYLFSVGKIRGKRENLLRLGSEGRVNAVHSGFHEGLVRLDYLPDAQGVARISSQGRQCLVSPCLAGCLTENT